MRLLSSGCSRPTASAMSWAFFVRIARIGWETRSPPSSGKGHGVLVFLQVDAMGEESNRLKESSVPVLREYGIGAQILVDLGLRRIRIMTNDERRIVALEGYGLELEERLPLGVESPLPGFRRLGKETGKPRLQRS